MKQECVFVCVYKKGGYETILISLRLISIRRKKKFIVSFPIEMVIEK